MIRNNKDFDRKHKFVYIFNLHPRSTDMFYGKRACFVHGMSMQFPHETSSSSDFIKMWSISLLCVCSNSTILWFSISYKLNLKQTRCLHILLYCLLIYVSFHLVLGERL